MSQKLKPYPEYKGSGLPWLGKIPAHWMQKSIQAITRTKSIKGRTDLSLLSVYRDYGVIRRDSRNDNYNPEGSDLSTYKVVKPGNLVLNKMKTWQGSLGVSKCLGIVSPAYIVCEIIGNIYPMYLHYLLRSKPYVWFYNQISFGVRSNQWDMRYNDFKRIQIFLPPIQEQCQIANYLKEKEKTINRFIHNKQRLIELLNEQKQAIINKTVTRGISSNVRLKPSGVEWMGDISEHWIIKRLKLLVRNVTQNVTTKEKDEIYIALENIESWTGRLILSKEEIPFESQVKRFRSGDILFGKLRPYLAKVTRAQSDGVCVSELLVLRPQSDEIMSEFLEQKLRSFQIIDLVNSSTFGAKMPRADWGFIGNVLISIPKSIEEQASIISYISHKCLKIDTTIERTKREVEFFREYRTRLIADVVTGKVDVRGIPVEKNEGLEGLEDTYVQEELQEGEEIEETEEVLNAND